MKPALILCPHCSFPVVVHPVEWGMLRRCRQCREEYIPGGPPLKDAAARDQTSAARTKLRAAVRQQRRSIR